MRIFEFRSLLTGPRDECWHWPRGHFGNGYPAVRIHGMFEGKPVGAHRAAYVVLRGPLIEGGHLHHQCEHEWCYNPWHLRDRTPSTHRAEHVRDQCPSGHEYARPPGSHGEHRCRECKRQRDRRYRAKQRRLTTA